MDEKNPPSQESPVKEKTKAKKKGEARLPIEDAMNPYADLIFDPPEAEKYTCRKTFRGHLNSVAAVAFHPKKPILATVSDDETWKLWAVPNCDLIMSGEGHKDWLAGKRLLMLTYNKSLTA